jgi:hypothetical protein
MAIESFHDGFYRTTGAMKLLLGLQRSDARPLLWGTQFGFHGYSITVYTSHLEYLADLNACISPVPPHFGEDIVSRWRLANELLYSSLSPDVIHSRPLGSEYSGLAALALFTVLEEASRRISGAWDEEGYLLRDILPGDNITKWQQNGPSPPISRKKGTLIVSLEEKLEIMELALAPGVRATLASLNSAIQRPIVGDLPMSPLYSRLYFLRNQWMHGRRYLGWEAIFVTLVLAALYFGECGTWLATEMQVTPNGE